MVKERRDSNRQGRDRFSRTDNMTKDSVGGGNSDGGQKENTDLGNSDEGQREIRGYRDGKICREKNRIEKNRRIDKDRENIDRDKGDKNKKGTKKVGEMIAKIGKRRLESSY